MKKWIAILIAVAIGGVGLWGFSATSESDGVMLAKRRQKTVEPKQYPRKSITKFAMTTVDANMILLLTKKARIAKS